MEPATMILTLIGTGATAAVALWSKVLPPVAQAVAVRINPPIPAPSSPSVERGDDEGPPTLLVVGIPLAVLGAAAAAYYVKTQVDATAAEMTKPVRDAAKTIGQVSAVAERAANRASRDAQAAADAAFDMVGSAVRSAERARDQAMSGVEDIFRSTFG